MKNEQMPVELPTWLTSTTRDGSPFSSDTRARLAVKAEKDPRVAQTVATLQATIGSDPTSKEWGLVENFCRDASKQLLESHEHFVKANHCSTELNLLRLGAHMSDYSFAHFFQNLHMRITPKSDEELAKGAKNPPPISESEKRAYSEAVRVALPIVIELQPKVAIAFADSIYRTQHWYEQQPETERLYESLAQQQPRMLLTRFDKFATFANRDKLYAVAQDARANDPIVPSHRLANQPTTMVEADEAQVKFLEQNRPEMFGGLSSAVQSR